MRISHPVRIEHCNNALKNTRELLFQLELDVGYKSEKRTKIYFDASILASAICASGC